MSRWDERVQHHPTVEELTRLVAALDAAEEKLDGAEAVEAQSRLRNAAEYTRRAISNADPELIAPLLLDRLGANVQLARGEVDAFAEDGDVNRLLRANENADVWLDEANSLPIPEGVAEASETLGSFRRSAGQHLRHLEENTNELAQRLEARLNEATAGIEPLEDSVTELETEIERQKGRLDSAIEGYQGQFSESEARREQRFNEALEQRRVEAEQLRTDSQASFSEALQGLESSTEEALAELEERKTEAQRIVGILGNTGLTGHYQKVANQERLAAYTWVSIALAAFVLAVFSHLFFPGWDVEAATSWNDVLPKLVVSIPLILFGAFAIAESRMHRSREQFNRDMELQLASVDPYLRSLPPERAIEIKDRMFDRFSPAGSLHAHSKKARSPRAAAGRDASRRGADLSPPRLFRGGTRHTRHAATRAARTRSGRPNGDISSTANQHRQRAHRPEESGGLPASLVTGITDRNPGVAVPAKGDRMGGCRVSDVAGRRRADSLPASWALFSRR